MPYYGTVSGGGISLTGPATLSTPNGASWQLNSVSELLTLSTGAATTDTAANLLPANAILEAVVWRVTQTITTAASYSLGDATTAARFVSASVLLTAGQTGVGMLQMDGAVATSAAGPTQTAAVKLRVTCNATPGAGQLRLTVFYWTAVAPTS